MKPITQLFILPAIRRALRSRTGVSCAKTPRTMQIARRSPSVGFHLLCGFVLASGAANTVFAQNGTYYTIKQIVNPIPRTLFVDNGVEMNDFGTVTANTMSDDRSRIARPPFVCLNNDTSKVLPTLPKTSGGGNDVGARVSGISDSGLMIGYSPWFNGGQPVDQPPRTAYWMPNSNGTYSVIQLDTSPLPQENNRMVRGLSSDGRFALFSGGGSTVVAELKPADTGGGLKIFRFWQLASSSGMEIHYQPGAVGNGIVRVGGTCTLPAGDRRCCIWELLSVNDQEPTQTIKDLGPAPFAAPIYGMNGTGEAVGSLAYTSSATHGTYWNDQGISSSLPTLGGPRNRPSSINDAGWVTGFSDHANSKLRPHAFLWHPLDPRVIIDLNSLKSPADASGIELTEGMKITNSGDIVCGGYRKGWLLALASPAR